MKFPSKHPKSRLVVLFLTLMVFLTACQKTTQFNYRITDDPYTVAENVMNDLVDNFNPAVEKTVILAVAFNDNEIGLLQEHQLHDFSTITINSNPGGRIIISVPYDPQGPSRWRLLLNESKTSSKPYLPVVMNTKPDLTYDRLNFLIEPSFDTDLTFVLEDDVGNRTITFLAALRGFQNEPAKYRPNALTPYLPKRGTLII